MTRITFFRYVDDPNKSADWMKAYEKEVKSTYEVNDCISIEKYRQYLKKDNIVNLTINGLEKNLEKKEIGKIPLENLFAALVCY